MLGHGPISSAPISSQSKGVTLYLKNLTASSTTVAKRIFKGFKTIKAIPVATTAVKKSVLRKLVAVSTVIRTIKKRVSRTFLVTIQPTSVAMVTRKGYRYTASAVSGTASTIRRSVRRLLRAISISLVFRIRQISVSRKASGAGATTMNKIKSKFTNLSAAATVTTKVIKAVARKMTATITGFAVRRYKLFRNLKVTATVVRVLSPSRLQKRTVSTAAGNVVTMSRQKGIGKTLIATTSRAARLVKTILIKRITTATGIATLRFNYFKILRATVAGAANRVRGIRKSFRVIVTGSRVVSPSTRLFKFLSTVGSTSSRAIKRVNKRFNAVVSAIAASRNRVGKSITATASRVVVLTKLSRFKRTISKTVPTAATILKIRAVKRSLLATTTAAVRLIKRIPMLLRAINTIVVNQSRVIMRVLRATAAETARLLRGRFKTSRATATNVVVVRKRFPVLRIATASSISRFKKFDYGKLLRAIGHAVLDLLFAGFYKLLPTRIQTLKLRSITRMITATAQRLVAVKAANRAMTTTAVRTIKLKAPKRVITLKVEK